MASSSQADISAQDAVLLEFTPRLTVYQLILRVDTFAEALTSIPANKDDYIKINTSNKNVEPKERRKSCSCQPQMPEKKEQSQ